MVTMTHTTSIVRSLATAAALTLLASAALAGPLNPPAGGINSTGKTLTEVEPRIEISMERTPGDANSLYRIVSPGSYYLSGNVTCPLGRAGIEIAASGVTIDLKGFRIQGTSQSLDGIAEDTAATHVNIRITNGTIAYCGGNGISLADDGDSAHIDNIHVYSVGVYGIRCGDNAIIESCSVAFSGSSGITCFGSPGIIRNCTSYANGGSGIILTGEGVISDCDASNNISVGFRTGNGASVTNCVARQNGFDGFDLGQGNTVNSCSAYSNGAEGFDANGACTITGCTAAFNLTDGFLFAGSGTISGCSAYANTGDGIQVGSDSTVRENTCDNNGNSGDGAGIHVTGGDNRIEDNHCTDNDRGIDVDFAGNIIIRNTCAANSTDWVIIANNVYGPIIDRRNPASGAVNGFNATSTLGSTDPNANFSH